MTQTARVMHQSGGLATVPLQPVTSQEAGHYEARAHKRFWV